MATEVAMPSITMEISISKIEDSPRVRKCLHKGHTYKKSENPFCSFPAGLFTMTLGAGIGYIATDAMIEAYKNADIRVVLACGLFDIFALAIVGAGVMIIANRTSKGCQ